jgi:hypothetical protein
MMRRDNGWQPRSLAPGFSFPERTEDEHWSTIKIWDGSGRISVPLYRKVRGQDVWIKRTKDELDVALLKATATEQLAYLRKVKLPALAH